METPENKLALSVIVPARNEGGSLEACLRSLTEQSEPGWVLGEHWELLVVEDGSTDSTVEIARAHAGVRVFTPGPPPEGMTGKAQACEAGAMAARGEWLLFTSADTVHAAGSVSRAIVEANRYQASVLSWGPRQTPSGLLDQALAPVAASEVATAYQPAQVNDPAKRIGFASAAFFLIKAEAYRQLSGYGRMPESLTPEVDLAFAAKREKLPLRYRYAPEMLSSRRALENWRFALLVNNAPAIAAWRVLDVLLVWGLLLLALFYPVPFPWERLVLWLLWVRTVWRVYRRAARSGASGADLALAITLGLPIFVVWAYTGWYRARVLRRVTWSGREYTVGAHR